MTDQTMTEVSPGCGCSGCQSAANSTDAQYAENNVYSGTVEGNEASATSLHKGFEWSSNNLNYTFLTSLPSYYSSSDEEATNFEAFNTQMQQATVRIIEQIETFTDLNFSHTTNENQEFTLTFAQAYMDAGKGAHAYYPTTNLKGGDVWTNNRYANTQNPDEGNYGFYTLMHEIGHALGLQHSFEVFTGDEATSKYSVMAYDFSYGYSETFQLYDIKALQDLYGANTGYNIGDDTYHLKIDAKYTLWDAGGIDTFNASHVTTNVILDLTEGSFSTVGLSENIAIAYGTIIENATGGSGNDILGGNDVDNILIGNDGDDTFYESLGNDIIDGGNGNDTAIFDTALSNFMVSILNGFSLSLQNTLNFAVTAISYVENFVFNNVTYTFEQLDEMFGFNLNEINGYDNKNDKIYGTVDADRINGLGGDDIIKAGSGNDEINGGAGIDRLYGLAGQDTLNGGDGRDYLSGGDGIDILNGDAGNDVLYGGNQNDTLNGGEGNDTLLGERGDDSLYGGDGDDTLSGNNGADTLYGGNDNDRLHGNDGDDFLYGESGNDFLYGGNHNDIINGGIGDDALFGQNGNDTLNGNSGNDKLYGGRGNDILNGGDGDDLLYGSFGNDILNGGAGSNVLYGQGGFDIFVLNSSGSAQNFIWDFNRNEDRLDLSELMSGYDSATEDINNFIQMTKVGTAMEIAIDQSGSGSNYVTVATIRGARGLTGEDLENNGLLIL